MAESEAQLEARLLALLGNKGWERTLILDEVALEANFRRQFEILNRARFAEQPLTDAEWRRFRLRFEKGVFWCADQLRQKQLLERDSGSKDYVQLLDVSNWGNNTFQVASQITVIGRYENRYDVTLLVNGLPLVQIELKRRGGEIKEAFNQINRYRRESYTGLFNFIQLFVISNGTNTRYFANSAKADVPIPFTQTFYWTNEQNERLNDLVELNGFGDDFLPPSRIHEMIVKHMILRYRSKPQANLQELRVLRPYQIYAFQALFKHVRRFDTNAYVWHATGSGKTTTAFKTAEALSQAADELGIAKVIMLVDRRDLNGQSIEEFNAFSANFASEEQSREQLLRDLEGDGRFVICTIQKLANLIKVDHSALAELRKQKVIFMIDECHRSQFGEMHRDLTHYFTKAQLLGFTGTPRFEVNKSADGRTTTDIFDECVHRYLIQNAIFDENVLRFRIDYFNLLQENEHFFNERIRGVDKQELTLHPDYVRLVAEHVRDSYAAKTNDCKFNAMLALDSVQALALHYDALRKAAPELTVAAVFSYEANEAVQAGRESGKDVLARIMADYNAHFGSTFELGGKAAYSADIARRFGKLRQIDVLLVVDMFLTGSDFPGMSCLYYDKNSRHHTLLQHLSRTNRTLDESKVFGEVVAFRAMQPEVVEALTLYSDGANVDELLARPYDQVLADLVQQVGALKQIAPTPRAVDSLMGEEEQKEFILAFQKVKRTLIEVRPNVQFNLDALTPLGAELTEDDLANFTSKYLDLVPDRNSVEKKSILSEIDFKLELIRTDVINVDYIKRLLASVQTGAAKPDPLIDDITKAVQRTDNEHLRLKRDHLLRFLTQIVPQLPKNTDVREAFERYEQAEMEREIHDFATSTDISYDQVRAWVDEYEYENRLPHRIGDHFIGRPLRTRRVLAEEAKVFICTVVERYS